MGGETKQVINISYELAKFFVDQFQVDNYVPYLVSGSGGSPVWGVEGEPCLDDRYMVAISREVYDGLKSLGEDVSE